MSTLYASNTHAYYTKLGKLHFWHLLCRIDKDMQIFFFRSPVMRAVALA